MATAAQQTATWLPLSGALGAESRSLDVTTLDSAGGVWLRERLLEHQLLVIRDQRLNPSTLSRVAALLGERETYPFSRALEEDPFVVPIVHEPEDEEVFGGIWHTDSSYLERPPSMTVLYAVETPPRGGDTLFANMYAVYDHLSAGLRRILDGLRGEYSADLVHGPDGQHVGAAGADRNRLQPATPQQACHPVVRTHPDTGRRAVYASLAHTRNLVGFSRPDSLPLLELLSELTRRPEMCSRLTWQPGTLAIWDNRCVQHYPVNDYRGQRREMHRVIIAGDRPT